jgi:hypothetical protein
MARKSCKNANYSILPVEVLDYAFDQAPDRGIMAVRVGASKAIFPNCNEKEEFESILDEKIFDMLWEVRHGERDDYGRSNLEDLQGWRHMKKRRY